MLTLIADNLQRFMACNGSVIMPQHLPFNTDDDTVRNEGNAAHWLIEQVHKGKHSPEELLDRKANNGVFITAEMIEHVTPFLDAIMGRGAVECNTSHGSDQRYQVNGRADHIEHEVQQRVLLVSDFKYGWGIVEPIDNWTLISHAIGFIFQNRMDFAHLEQIVFRIFQPRPHHSLGKIRTHTMTPGQLWNKYTELHNALCAPTTMLRTSQYCKRCPALATCPAALQAGMNSIDVSETAYVANIDNPALGNILDNIERAIKQLEENKKAYSELALHRMKKGDIIPGYGTERELTNKQWKDGVNADFMRMMLGYDLRKKDLITPGQAVKAGLLESVVDSFCERREKGIKLVRMDADKLVKKMFGGLVH